MRTLLLAGACLSLFACAGSAQDRPAGLLFYLSAEKGTTADIAAPGTAVPTIASEVSRIVGGARGAAIQCGDLQRLAWWAPGNIYAQRGTLAFFWRSRYPVGPTEFPVFRVGCSDHSSWDMVWLRIDYNGHGFDAFVTDTSLARVRISATIDPFPAPEAWTHLALAWDETRGLRLYVNGRLAGEQVTTASLDLGLDQFGPHSRIISPYQVQSDYNFVRGGDIDEVRIYDRALAAEQIALVAQGRDPELRPLAPRTLADPAVHGEWWTRFGFGGPQHPPPALPAGRSVAIRKVEIHDAFDLKRWWWKATDGIRETTWPGVYNRSRLPGRHDYFQLPDWDCYVESGRAITFALPAEPWNHLEISGSAWGRMELLPADTPLETADRATATALLFQRPRGPQKTIHPVPLQSGGRIRFTNAEPENPIGELVAYHVAAGAEPAGSRKLTYHLAPAEPTDPSLAPLTQLIAGRFPRDERTTLVARPAAAASEAAVAPPPAALPLVHILIPNTWGNLTEGLDGLALDLPALGIAPTHGELLPLNIQVHDPLWPARLLFDFTSSVDPRAGRTLWLDLRDRFLPAGKGLWLTLAAADGGSQLGAALTGATLRLVFKRAADARAEHEHDRFTQVRDNYAMLVEEHPRGERFNLWNRFEADLNDLLRINPSHELGRHYAAAGLGTLRVPFAPAAPPAGVPAWASLQVELLGRIKRFVNWYIDHRQSDYGDFGGGISDDTDFTNVFPGVALMGCNPEKIRTSLRALLDAAYRNGMFTRGLPTIQSDELHSYEEGINCLAQNLILDYASPRQLERAMETTRGVESITGINAAGHRHIISSYYSGSRVAVEEPWGIAKPYSYLVCQVPQLLVDFNGHPAARHFLLELTDGLLAHRRPAGGRSSLPSAIRFSDDHELSATRSMNPWHLFWGAWKWTEDRRYLDPLLDGGLTSVMSINGNALDILSLRASWGQRFNTGERPAPNESRPNDGRPPAPVANFRGSTLAHFLWQLGGDKRHLENLYTAQIETCAAMEYINTEGSLWIDRVGVPTTDLQRARLGGVALVRNALYPGHTVSWSFSSPATDQSVALLLPDATPTSFTVIACNVETFPVAATMTGWNVAPGTWEISEGIDNDGDDHADAPVFRTATFARSHSLALTLPARATTVLTLRLKTPGTPYWSRPDLGIDRADVTPTADGLRIRIHSLGSVPVPASNLVVRDAAGKVLARAAIPPLAAPLDLYPRTTDVVVALPAATSLPGACVELDPEHRLEEITTQNNTVRL